jgi:hypothetical protein
MKHISMTTADPGAVNTFLPNHEQVKQLTTIFTTSPNTADVTQCTNSCTIAIFPHTSKILLTITHKQLQPYTAHGTAMEQAGLRKWRAARDQIVNVRESWTVQGGNTKC